MWRRGGLLSRSARPLLCPFEQAKGKSEPEARRKKPRERGGEDGTHLGFGWLAARRTNLEHSHDGPGKAFEAKQQRRPGPDKREGRATPPEERRRGDRHSC